ncbi:MAG: response regulator [Spirochaetales bacterium]|nr:response regulator [Spirochaetales bacterium]
MTFHNYRVLIIDDEEKIVKLISNLIDWDTLPLSLAGTAHDGLSALELIDREEPDIVILDIRMPGLTGLDIISRVKQSGRDIQFIIISGYRHFEYAHNAIKFGVEDYLLKPVKEEELNRTLKNIIERKRDSRKLEEREQSKREQDFIKILFDGRGKPLPGDLGVTLPYDTFEVYYLKCDLNRNEWNGNEAALLEDKVSNTLKTVFSDGRTAPFFYRDGGGIYILLNFRSEDSRIIGNYFFNLIEGLHSYRDLFRDLTATVSASGPFEDLSDFSGRASAAAGLIQERYVRGSGAVIENRPAPDQIDISDIVSSAFRRDFLRAVDCLDSEESEKLVSELYKTLCELKVSGRLLYRTLQEILKIFRFNGENSLEIETTFGREFEQLEQILAEQSSGKSLYSITASFFRDVLSELQKRKRNRDERPILDAKKYIQENFYLNLSLEDVSSRIGISPTYLSTLFKKKTGTGFLEYLTMVRVEEAKELLADHRRSIADTAGEVGYKDTKHFTKQFRKVVGLSPAEYRKIYY